MKKSLIALLLVVALVMTVSAFAVSAEETEAPVYASDLEVAEDGLSATGWCAHCQQERTDWQPLPLVSGHQTIAAGHWFLNADHTSGGAIRPSTNGGEHIIHLNGHTFTRTGATGALYPSTIGTKTFVMADTAEVGAFINSNANGQAVTQDGTGAAQELTLYSGQFISQATAAATASGSNNYEGGVVDLHSGANVFNMYGGTISGGKAYNGGAIFVKNANAQVNIYGGTITNCSATNGGAIYCNPGRVTISGGTITNCTAATGGAYWASGANAKLNITGGEISNCSTTNAAGAIYVQYQSTENTFSGGTIKNCSAPSGGAIYISGSGSPTITMSGTAKIESCSATKTGGAVQIAGSVATAPAHFNMQGGTISECTAVQGVGGVYNTHGVFSMSGGKIENCTADAGGGASYRMNSGANCVFNMSGGEITGGETKQAGESYGGGNILFNVSAKLNITGGKITNGKAATHGGNICFTAAPAAGSVISGLEITGGMAGNKTVDAEGAPVAPASTEEGRGGNISTKVAISLENCVIRDGIAWGAANPGGGNLYLNGNATLNGCTITGGESWNAGGNIVLHGAPVVTINGDSYIAGGVSHKNWGGNIGMTHGSAAATVAGHLTLDGNTIIDGTGAHCRTDADYGNNIGMSHAANELYIKGNVVIKNGNGSGRKSIAFNTGAKVYLEGTPSVDMILVRNNAPAGSVVLNAGFAGSALVMWQNATIVKTVAPGKTVHETIAIGTGYENTGSLKVNDSSNTGYITFVDAEEGVLKVASITGFKKFNEGTENEYTVETGFGTLDAVVDAGYAYAKLYKGGTYNLTAKTNEFPIDLNNQVVTINTNGNKLAPIDWRTDGNVNAKYTQLTVDVDANVMLVTQNPINGRQYLNVKVTQPVDELNRVGEYAEGETEEKTFWTSNRVQVELTKVSIRTTNAGIYYTTKIGTNANAAAAMVDYGTAVTVMPGVESIGANFMERLTEDGILYTATTLEETAAFTKTARSALISGILSTENDADTNIANAETAIVANSYVTAIVDGKEVKIMADKGSKLTYKEVIIKLDNAVHDWNVKQPAGYAANVATAANFYKAWEDVFSGWNLENLMAEAAKVA